ncbi:polyprenyl diphosphate synthase [Larsenimonas rhizosphaerae]|uniref:Ditrans,polycis-undecaprenyl-diphosphate synthase ((2E,6E)-farnesyl-diphosphate specific) n=1 Tax=Larsenimonas rhizosphaerae TaxID=2944682 RepID=A0AA41ZHN1_9GAMM|nr:polyprenyl diphosphate synthase [Larsenimonas rhizosphaerae]MCM2129666.1 polyprenyl diphosphate synthase [Larsenimonas rhizosphaerae]MCX2524324.1 polyprenyl diphosphate synthase [Larsenimonas rhizosphaerae]
MTSSLTHHTLPRHVAVIMDGNNRWAKAHGLSGLRGHYAGVESVRHVVRRASERGVKAVTLFAFSSENWRRPADEISGLMELFVLALRREIGKLHRHNVRLSIIGERERLPKSLQKAIERGERRTCNNTGLHLIIAANYGGRWDITQAARRLAQQVADGELLADDIDENRLEREMCLHDVPEVDLCIRTSGEQRISNFLLWQLAYAEFYFSPLFWPDFDGDAFDEAIESYAHRHRRFGMTDDQIEVERA